MGPQATQLLEDFVKQRAGNGHAAPKSEAPAVVVAAETVSEPKKQAE
jgi:hypothetical protein